MYTWMETLMSKILIPVEETDFTKAQVDFLGQHKLEPDAEITILAVLVPLIGQDYGFAMPHAYIEPLQKQNEKYFDGLVAFAKDRLKKFFPNHKINTLIETGRAPAEILRVAAEGNFDWIVMGSHGRAGFERLLLGSVSLSVISHAKCSVSIVRLSQNTAKQAQNL